MTNNSNPHPNCNSIPTNLACAGITSQFLLQNEVHLVTAAQANELCGFAVAGTIFPYRNQENGSMVPLYDPTAQRFSRLRKTVVTTGGKYLQRRDTSVHPYFPINILERGHLEDLVLIEGEKKALSLCDPHHRFSVPAVGLSGFYGFQSGRTEGEEPKLVPELEDLMQLLRPKRIQCIGDNDTTFNHPFFQAVARLRLLLPDVELVLPRIPLNEPKGIDDCREKHGDKFEWFFRSIVEKAVVVDVEDTIDNLALRIAIPALEFVAKMGAEERYKINQRIIRFAADLPALAQLGFLRAAAKPTGIGLTELRKQVQQCATESAAKLEGETENRLRPLIVGYYAGPRGSYYRKQGAEYRAIPSREDVLLSLMVEAGLTGPAPRAGTAAKLGLNLIQREQGVGWAGQVAGYPAGLHRTGQKTILITSGPSIIPGTLDGDATMIVEMLADLMGLDAGQDYIHQQLMTLFAWIAQRRRALQNPDVHLPAPVLVLVGERDSGKDFVAQHIITPLIGGRKFDPIETWTGRSPFNEAAFAAEHLLVSDPEVPPDDQRALRQFKSAMLRVVTNEGQSLYEKFLPAQHLRPIQAVTITMNPGPDGFALLPLGNRHALDKLILLRCHPIRDLPGGGAEERRAFLARVQAALPAFAGQLDALVVPKEFRNGRFGVAAFQHPDLLAMAGVKGVLGDLVRMLNHLVTETGAPVALRGTARELHTRLEKGFGKLYADQFADPKSLGKAFMEIRRDVPGWAERLTQDGKLPSGTPRNYATAWRIKPPASWVRALPVTPIGQQKKS